MLEWCATPTQRVVCFDSTFYIISTFDTISITSITLQCVILAQTGLLLCSNSKPDGKASNCHTIIIFSGVLFLHQTTECVLVINTLHHNSSDTISIVYAVETFTVQYTLSFCANFTCLKWCATPTQRVVCFDNTLFFIV